MVHVGLTIILCEHIDAFHIDHTCLHYKPYMYVHDTPIYNIVMRATRMFIPRA